MKNLYKTMFLMLTLTGTTITISSQSWMMMWVGLEINLLSIIPLLTNVKNKMESEAAMKYFITQALASTIFLFSIISMMESSWFMNKTQSSMVMDCAILTKMGAAPFHFWFPEVMEGLSWTSSTLMLTWQKIAPMVIFLHLPKSMMFIVMIIISSMMISGLMGINQTSMRKILAYSSINHIGWMIAAMTSNQSTWIVYMLIYTIMTLNITMMFKMNNSFSIQQMINTMNNKKKMKILFSMNFLSLGGLPPFVGFIPKWMIINEMINSSMFFMTITMIIMTLMTLFFYMRITLTSIILTSSETSKINPTNKNKFTLMFFNSVTLSLLALSSTLLNLT
uniref:NADH-ubiquinone oxidoreductase chain 2 n=1 Tax=Trogoderma variabile TaxID=888089 RepID=A0A7D5Q2C7_9COLE